MSRSSPSWASLLAAGIDKDDDLVDRDDSDEEADTAYGDDKHAHLCVIACFLRS